MASAMAKYGKFYWCVKSRLAEDDEIYVVADEVQTLSDGSLVFFTVPLPGRAPSTWRSHEEIGRP